MMHLLITRPHHQASVTAEHLEALGHVCTTEPLLCVEHTGVAQPAGDFDGVIMTSSNGLPVMKISWSENFRRTIPLLTTGTASARLARSAGFENLDFVVGSAVDLVDRVPSWMDENNMDRSACLIYPCAEITAHDVHGLLLNSHINCVRWPVYRTSELSQFSAEVEKKLRDGEISGVLLYSKRTAHTFVGLMTQAGIAMKGLRTFVLSHEIYDILPEELKINAQYPQYPEESALLQLVSQ